MAENYLYKSMLIENVLFKRLINQKNGTKANRVQRRTHTAPAMRSLPILSTHARTALASMGYK